jgi:DNA-binding MarR family transcriptional regulator
MDFKVKELPTEALLKKLASEFPDADPAAISTNLRLLKLANDLTRALEVHFHRFGLTTARFGILIYLYDTEEGYPPSEIARRVGVTKGNLTSLIDSLEKQTLLVRTQHETDRRVVLLKLTTKGRKLLQQILPIHYQRIKHLHKFMKPSDISHLNLCIEKLNGGILAFIEQTNSTVKTKNKVSSRD